jgi:hypothetical protein
MIIPKHIFRDNEWQCASGIESIPQINPNKNSSNKADYDECGGNAPETLFHSTAKEQHTPCIKNKRPSFDDLFIEKT